MSDLRARTRNCIFDNGPMVGVVRTVQLTESEDFLAVLRGLNDAKAGEVLCVNTMKSRKAVAGGLFLKEAQRKGLSGIIVDGTIRDIASMGEGSCFMYSKSVNPCSGSIQSPGVMQCDIDCGGVSVSPGEIVVADADGVIVAPADDLEEIIETAEIIMNVEASLVGAMSKGNSLHSLTNYEEHIEKRLKGEDSSLQFK
eukprot:5283_1